MKASLVIPCYWVNDELVDMTARCLNSVNDTTDDEPQEVIIVDDGSPLSVDFEDDTDLVQHMQTVRREKNGGYAAAANMGMFRSAGDVIVVGNNDLIFTEGWLAGLLSVLDSGYDIATCWTSDQNVKLEDRIEEDAKFGSIFAIKRRAYELIGPFDEQFRGYFSDLDYRRRALDAGLKIGKDLNLVIKHTAKATYKQTDPDDMEYQRSKALFEAKHGFVE